MTVGVLGAGALGQLLAHQLIEHGLPAHLLTRPGGQPETLPHQLIGLDGQTRQAELPRHPSDRPNPLSLVLVLTKAHHCLEALAPLMTWLPNSVPVVLLHNGLGPQFEAPKRWPTHSWWAGSLTDGALRLAPRQVRHTGQGVRRAGPLGPDAPIPPALATLGFESDPDILAALWQKLTVNLVINPLTARDRVPNGALLKAAYQPEIAALCQEITALGQALGYPEPAEAVRDRVLTVAQATAANRSSMLQDVEAGRPTELPAITGYLLAEARRLELPCPHHRRLMASLAPA
ncbi:ketopantoate reductase family protein [Ferrimonas balearica]|uniref:ketopantoate reductase family protein n=1 Tax=Ferrimonas balearica TaxID=44012 RepID=UPI001C98F21F|nr:2-dehydropantoate 2-reductase [Ferrimonas balearica]MBY5990583.1 2-dehydropantoate 2-reductase [Ferrimonas balearica]